MYKEEAMVWCLISLAIPVMLLGIMTLTAHPIRRNRPLLGVGQLMRGCLAVLCLLVVISLVGLALLIAQ